MNKYVNFVSDDHLLKCIKNLHHSYIVAKNDISKAKFYSNKIDTIKLFFDSHFNHISERELIESEMSRQIDKSINNALGTFHEEILGGINGFSRGNLSGYDIKSDSNNLFADIKNKHNTMNSGSSESLYQKLINFADANPDSKCYWVQILAKSSFNCKWKAKLNGKNYSHDRGYKISGDQFYKLLSGENDAFFNLYKALPNAIHDYLKSIQTSKTKDSSASTEIIDGATLSNRTILNQITFENFSYYLGFDKL